MKRLLVLALTFSVLLAVSCGPGYDVVYLKGPKGETGATGSQGNNGANGNNGLNGVNGANGHNALVAIVNVAPTCLNGGAIVLAGTDLNDNTVLDSSEVSATQAICNGQNGTNGTNGVDGHNALIGLVGQSSGGGASCSTGGITVLAGTDQNDNNVLEPFEVSQSKDVCNGQNGANGVNGINGTNAPPTAFTPVALINPCGDAPGIYDEIFIKLQNGTLIASFSDNANGQNTRFSILTAGSYQTTDGDHCVFSLNSSGVITSESHHY